MADEASAAKRPAWAVALVHGIGETQPVKLIRDVTRAITDAKGPRPGIALDREVRIVEGGPRGDQHYADGTLPTGERVRFATAYWSDIAQVKQGVLQLISGILLGAFGARYFAMAANRASPLSWLLGLVLRAMSWWLIVIKLPLIMITAIYSTFALVGWYVLGRERIWLQTPFIVFATWLITWIIYRFCRKQTKAWERRQLFRYCVHAFWLTSAAVGILFLAGMRDDPDAPVKLGIGTGGLDSPVSHAVKSIIVGFGDIIWLNNWVVRAKALDETGLYLGLLYTLQVASALVMVALMLAALVLLALKAPRWLLWWRRTRDERRSLLIATVSVVSMWIVMLLLFWPERIVTSLSMAHYTKTSHIDENSRNKRNEPIAVPDDSRGQPVLPVLPRPVRSFDVLRWEFTRVDTYSPTRHYAAVWFEWVTLSFVSLVGLVVVLVIARRRVRHFTLRGREGAALAAFAPAKGPHARRRARPRLIIPWLYTGLALLLLSVIPLVTLLSFAATIDRIPQWITGDKGAQLPHEILLGSVALSIFVVLFIFALLGGAHKILDGIKLLLDVVNHFVVSKGSYPIRNEIALRLVHTLDFLVDGDHKPHLLVIAHSQGTVITFDTLFGDGVDQGVWHTAPLGWGGRPLRDRVESLTIVTVGSPLTNIYQRYFGHIYRLLAQVPAVAAARDEGRVRWINAYRVDDYVGTYIENSLPGFPVNVPLEVGGHTAYWEPKAMRQVFEQNCLKIVLGER